MTDRSGPGPRVFYGWVMLAIAILMAMATMPGQTIVVALFNPFYERDLSLSVAQVSLAYAVGTMLAALPLPLVGRAADRFGLRVVVLAVAVGFAGGLAVLGQARHAVVLAAGFFLIRLLGQGSLGMLAGHTIAMWFERKLGRVHSVLAVVGFSLGSFLVPFPAAWLIAEVGWRGALPILGGAVLLVVVPPAVFLFRNKPEDIGQRLDGDAAEREQIDAAADDKPAPIPPQDPAFTVRQAIATPAYWIMVPAMITSGLVGTALLFHMGAILSSAGVEASDGEMVGLVARANAAFPVAFGSMTIAFGWLVDKIEPRRLLPLGPLLMASSCAVCLAAVSGRVPEEWVVPTVSLGMALFGASQAVVVAVSNPTIARYFGRTHHGAIRGTVHSLSVIGTGVGPVLAGWGYGLAGGSFAPVLAVFAAAGVPLAIAAAFLRRPEPR